MMHTMQEEFLKKELGEASSPEEGKITDVK